MSNNKFYNLELIPGNSWHDLILEEYSSYKKEHKPVAAAVTYLVFSGMSHPGFRWNYFSRNMANSYANAFQIHQKPCITAPIHKYWIHKLPYMYYLILIAAPVDVYVHIYQFFYGEHNTFLEGGAFFIPYQISHWSMLGFTLFSPIVCWYLPQATWYYYIKFIRFNLIFHEYIYKKTIRKLSLLNRLLEFSLFIGFIIFSYNIFMNNINFNDYYMITKDVIDQYIIMK